VSVTRTWKAKMVTRGISWNLLLYGSTTLRSANGESEAVCTAGLERFMASRRLDLICFHLRGPVRAAEFETVDKAQDMKVGRWLRRNCGMGGLNVRIRARHRGVIIALCAIRIIGYISRCRRLTPTSRSSARSGSSAG
jgi:hypothetical protein